MKIDIEEDAATNYFQRIRNVIVDCSPGLDDAYALIYLLRNHDKVNVIGITTVAGDISAERARNNARYICDSAGYKAMGVFAGCEQSITPLGKSLPRKSTPADNLIDFSPHYKYLSLIHI